MGTEEASAKVMKEMWNMLYANDAGIAAQSSPGLTKKMGIIVGVCAALGLAMSEKTTETTHMPERPIAARTLRITTAGQEYTRPNEPVYRGDTLPSMLRLWSKSTADNCFRRQCKELHEYIQYDRLNASLEIKFRTLKAEVPETTLFGCMARSLNADRCNQLGILQSLSAALHRLSLKK